MSTVIDREGVPFKRTLKELAQSVNSYDRAPSAHDYTWVFGLQREGKLEGEMKEGKLTDAEKSKLLGWLKLEKAELDRREREAKLRQLENSKAGLAERIKTDSRLTGYVLLPCGHMRRRTTMFNISKPTEVTCFYSGCGKTFEFRDETFVEKGQVPKIESKGVVSRLLGK